MLMSPIHMYMQMHTCTCTHADMHMCMRMHHLIVDEPAAAERRVVGEHDALVHDGEALVLGVIELCG